LKSRKELLLCGFFIGKRNFERRGRKDCAEDAEKSQKGKQKVDG
jgi:hypothetical protein